MQLISIDTTENDSANSKDVTMESLECSVVGKEKLESFLDIPSYGNVNGAVSSTNGEEYTTNGDEPMEVDNEETQSSNNISEETKPEETSVENRECDAVPPIETLEQILEEKTKVSEENENIDECSSAEVSNVPDDKANEITEEVQDAKTTDNTEVDMETDKDDMCSKPETSVFPVDKLQNVDGVAETQNDTVDGVVPENSESNLLSKTDSSVLENNTCDPSSSENVEIVIDETKKTLCNNVTDLDYSDTSSVDINTEDILLKDDTENLTLNLSPNIDENILLNGSSDGLNQDFPNLTEATQPNDGSKTSGIQENDPKPDDSEASDNQKVDSGDPCKSNEDCDTLNFGSNLEEISKDAHSPKTNDIEKTDAIISNDNAATESLSENATSCKESPENDIPNSISTDVVEKAIDNVETNIKCEDKNKDLCESAPECRSEITETQDKSEPVNSVVSKSVDNEHEDDKTNIFDIVVSEDIKNIPIVNESSVSVKVEPDVDTCESSNIVNSISEVRHEVKLETDNSSKSQSVPEVKLETNEPVTTDKDTKSAEDVDSGSIVDTQPMDVSNAEIIANDKDEKSSDSNDKDDVEIVNKPSEVESMVVSDDDEDAVITVSKDDETKDKQEKETAQKSDEQNKVVASPENKDDGKKIDEEKKTTETDVNNKKESVCLSVDDDDDDDIVVIDDGSSKKPVGKESVVPDVPAVPEIPSENKESESKVVDDTDLTANTTKDKSKPSKLEAPICPLTIMKTLKPALDSMSREDLEEYIVVKIVESISGRSAISDLQLKLKSQEKSMEEWKKKVMALSKQNKDLTIVLRNVCDEQQKRLKENPLPIKITRSVGLQVGYPSIRTPAPMPGIVTSHTPGNPINNTNNIIAKQVPKVASPKTPATPVLNNTPILPAKRTRGRPSNPSTPATSPAPITTPTVVQSPPVSLPTPAPHVSVRPRRTNAAIAPKLVPTPPTPTPVPTKAVTNIVSRSVLKTIPDTPKAEKRSAVQSIDLTDDEPPPKIPALRTPPRPTPTIRAVNTNQLTNNTPNKVTYVVNNSGGGTRQVYIPINAQGQNVQSNSVMVRGKVLNKVPIPNLRQLPPSIRIGQPIPIRPVGLQHPAPLPQSINSKAQMHPSWKWIPPRPTLKIARVENGIVISWEMNDFSEAQHEPIASYQIFAYQEATTQPTTDLWKKIGDVKALPLPMACTLTHFMAGFKYFFAVRAIDIRTRVGPFSAPGQITLLNNKK